MILMYGITTASGSELILSNVLLDDEKLTVKYAYPVSYGPHAPDASMPLTKW